MNTKYITFSLFYFLKINHAFNILAFSNNNNINNAYKNIFKNNKHFNLFCVDNEDYLNKMLKFTDFLFIDNNCFIENSKIYKKLDDEGIPYLDYTKLGYIHNLKLVNNEPYDFYIDTINDKKIKLYCHNSNLKLITSKEKFTPSDKKKIEKSINTLDTLYNKVNIDLPNENITQTVEDFIYYLIFKKINEKYYLDCKYF